MSWKSYAYSGDIGTNLELIDMISDVVKAYKALGAIDPRYYQIVRKDLIFKYHDLVNAAVARKLKFKEIDFHND